MRAPESLTSPGEKKVNSVSMNFEDVLDGHVMRCRGFEFVHLVFPYTSLPSIKLAGWWFQIFLFSPLFGEDSHFD